MALSYEQKKQNTNFFSIILNRLKITCERSPWKVDSFTLKRNRRNEYLLISLIDTIRICSYMPQSVGSLLYLKSWESVEEKWFQEKRVYKEFQVLLHYIPTFAHVSFSLIGDSRLSITKFPGRHNIRFVFRSYLKDAGASWKPLLLRRVNVVLAVDYTQDIDYVQVCDYISYYIFWFIFRFCEPKDGAEARTITERTKDETDLDPVHAYT